MYIKRVEVGPRGVIQLDQQTKQSHLIYTTILRFEAILKTSLSRPFIAIPCSKSAALKMYTRLISSILLSSVASAGVIAERAAPQMVWVSPNGGDTQVRFGDEKVYVGDCEPKNIINTVYDNCYGEGFCNPKSWTVQCVQGDRASHTITITAPEGQYQPWIKNGLVEAMNAAITLEGIVDKKRITAMSGGGCVGCP